MNLRHKRYLLWFSGCVMLMLSAVVAAYGLARPVELVLADGEGVAGQELVDSNKLIEKTSLPISAYEKVWNKRLRMPPKKQPPKARKVKKEKPPPKLEVELVGTIYEEDHSKAIFKAKINRRSEMVFVEPGEMINDQTQLLRMGKETAWVLHFGQEIEVTIDQDDESGSKR